MAAEKLGAIHINGGIGTVCHLTEIGSTVPPFLLILHLRFAPTIQKPLVPKAPDNRPRTRSSTL